jgi:hypothetical protein
MGKGQQTIEIFQLIYHSEKNDNVFILIHTLATSCPEKKDFFSYLTLLYEYNTNSLGVSLKG